MFVGLIVGILFIYLSIRGVDYETVINELRNANIIYFLPAIILIIIGMILRSVRLGVMLYPLEKISQKTLFPITCVGFMAVVLVPMRVGELVRPYLIGTKSQIPFTSSLATIFVERVLDLLTLVTFFSVVIVISDLPEWLIKFGYITFIILAAIIGLIFFLAYRTENAINILSPMLTKISQSFSMKIEELVRTFVSGFRIVSRPTILLFTFFLSVLIWAIAALAIYILYFCQNLNLPLTSSFVVLFITMVGISLPAAPGGVGNFQFGCIVALSIFNLSKSDALAFSIVYHFVAIGISVILGLTFLPFIRITFKDIRKGIIIHKSYS